MFSKFIKILHTSTNTLGQSIAPVIRAASFQPLLCVPQSLASLQKIVNKNQIT